MPKYYVVCLWPARTIEASSEETARFMAVEMIERTDFDVQEITDEYPPKDSWAMPSDIHSFGP